MLSRCGYYFFSLLVIGLGSISMQAQNSYTFLKLDFDEVRIYFYDGSFAIPIVSKGKIDSTIVDTMGYQLSQTQISDLDKLLSYRPKGKAQKRYNWECMGSKCFEPHHGVVFYSNQKIVGHLSICFSCNTMETDLGETEMCPIKLISLFDSFDLKIEGKIYKCQDSTLDEAIHRINERRYGNNYAANRLKSIRSH